MREASPTRLVLGRRMDDALKYRAWTALDAFGLRDLV